MTHRISSPRCKPWHRLLEFKNQTVSRYHTLMRKAALTILLLLFIASLSYAVQETAWINYNSVEGRYNVSLPEQPKLATQEAASADGQKLLQYLAKVQQRDVIYQVGYFDLLPGTVFSLDSARAGMVNAVKG